MNTITLLNSFCNSLLNIHEIVNYKNIFVNTIMSNIELVALTVCALIGYILLPFMRIAKCN